MAAPSACRCCSVPGRDPHRAALLRFSDGEVLGALSVAGLIDMAVAVMAAAAFRLGHGDVAMLGTAFILLLNVVLLLQTFGVPIPGLPDAG